MNNVINYDNLNADLNKINTDKEFYWYVNCETQIDKYKLAEFIYNNTDNFVMNTFALLWESRNFWQKFRPLIITKNGKIIGLHAFAEKQIDNKLYLKTYYIVVDKSYRGKGIAKKLTYQVLKDFQNQYNQFYVNSVEGSDGEYFYRKTITNRPSKKVNEFGTTDLIFKGSIFKILKKDI